jgi:hypothetical protein
MTSDFWIVKQGGQPWSSKVLGHGDPTDPKNTIGWRGCMLCAFTAALNRLTGKRLSPADVNTVMRGVPDGFTNGAGKPGILFNLPLAAEHFGLRAPEHERIRSHVGDPALSALALDCVARKSCLAIIHVDTDSELPKGDPYGEHFILATRRVPPSASVPEHIECMDPAPGMMVWLHAGSMEGTSKWGPITKTYRAVSVAPIYKP